MVTVAFDVWGRDTVAFAADRLATLLPNAAEAELGGEGGPRTVGPGYRSAFVRFRSPRLGAASIWLFAVAAGHEYAVARNRPQLGAGILSSSDLTPFKQGAIIAPMGGPVQYFRWRKTLNSWESHLTYIDADIDQTPGDAGAALARRAADGLRRLRLVN